MSNMIRNFNYFGFIPQFRFMGETKFKSTLGGIIFLSYGLFAFYYFNSQFVVFLQNRYTINSSWNLIKNSQNYKLTTKELYFGVGFMDSGYREYNLSFFQYYNITLRILNYSNDGTLNLSYYPLESCDFDLFIDKSSQNLYSNETLKDLKNRTQYYLCPNKNFSPELGPSDLSGQKIFLSVYLAFTNTSIISQADDQINKLRPKATLIYKNILINSDNKINPYTPFIDYIWRDIDTIASKKTELLLNPFEMLDDDNILGDRKFQNFKSNYSTQENGTIFQTSVSSNLLSIYQNRSLGLVSNNFYRFTFILNSNLSVTMRSYKKFSIFLAEVSSILSTLLMILSAIMTKYDLIQGKNNIVKFFFSDDSINNLRSIKCELDSILNKKEIQINSKKNTDLSKKIKIISKIPICNEVNLMTCKLENEIHSNEIQIEKGTNDLMKIQEKEQKSQNL